jgi:hypothetical protein
MYDCHLKKGSAPQLLINIALVLLEENANGWIQAGDDAKNTKHKGPRGTYKTKQLLKVIRNRAGTGSEPNNTNKSTATDTRVLNWLNRRNH